MRTLSGIARWAGGFARSVALAALLLACGSTTDSLGSDEFTFRPLTPPRSYPSAFIEAGKSPSEIDDRIEAAFQQLFEGDPETEAIYFEDGNHGWIQDVYHEDVRTEGIGYAMMIAVQLDKREIFERLWRYTKAKLQYPSTDPRRGYFQSWCHTSTVVGMEWTRCADPFGHQQMLMALLFAGNRWGRDANELDYVDDARALLEVMRSKEAENQGVVDDVTNMFDAATKLVFDVPELSSAGITRPSIEIPAFYELWAQATGDSFWRDAAAAARDHWKRTTDPVTGLTPLRAHFNGDPMSAWANFTRECYRTQIHWAIDQIWFPRDPWMVEATDKLLGFFASKGLTTYGASYTLDGTELADDHESALVIANGISAQIARVPERLEFVDAVWTLPTPTGTYRYYRGLLDLTALLILSGRYRVY